MGISKSELFPSKWLATENYPNPEKLTIASVRKEVLPGSGEVIGVMRFAGVEKGLILNTTNFSVCEALFGTDTDIWEGHNIEIYTDPTVSYRGKVTGGLRLREAGEPPVSPF